MQIKDKQFPDFVITDEISEDDQEIWIEGYRWHIERITEIGTQSDKQLLEMSIEKWDMILWAMDEFPDRYIDDWGWVSCPLCARYYDSDGSCSSCPIGDFTVDTLCGSTPYDDYQESEMDGLAAAREDAEGMVDLLQRILNYKNWNETRGQELLCAED